MKKKLRIYLNLFMAAMIMIQWIRMCLNISGQSFMTGGFRTLKYFTILSNLLEAFACVLFVINGNELIKYVGAVSVGLTFTVVMVFLGPLFGYRMMFYGASLWFHALIPLMAMAEFVMCNSREMTSRDNLYAVFPMLVYGIGYVGNIIIRGIPHNDWYGFMSWGYPVGTVIFALIVAVTYLIGLLLRKINEKVGAGK